MAEPTEERRLPRVLVMTVVHRPDDARIRHRQVRTLIAEGFPVTYAAPWRATGVDAPEGLAKRDLPRSSGRDRLAALLAARDLLRAEADAHDVIVIHDPELLVAVRLAGVDRLPPVVWDVHEDTAVALGDRPWVPRVLRRVLALGVRRLERWAERHVHIILAEDGYRSRFRRVHPVVRNHPWAAEQSSTSEVAPSAYQARERPPRVVYVGRISRGRGLETILALGHALGDQARVEVAGDADADVRELLDDAVAAGAVQWHGFVPNDAVGALLTGASVGLSLLDDDPNYRVSMPSKVIEYLAHGLPVVATPLPAVQQLLEEHDAGIVVPFGDADASVAAVRRILDDPALLERLAQAGRTAAASRTWEVEGTRLSTMLRTWAR
jgi:glycosyltransferase involved in cell wall biosynthesis